MMMQACANHIQYQLPNEFTNVGFTLEGVQCSDAGLHVAMASIHIDIGTNGKCNDFESSAVYLLPYDPIAKSCAVGSKYPSTEVSETR